MLEFNVSAIISEAWEYAKKHFLMMAVFLIVIYIISSVIEGICGGPSSIEISEAIKSQDAERIAQVYSENAISSIISFLISSILSIGIVATALNIVMGKKDKVDFSGYQMPFEKWVKLICANIIYFTIVIAGFFCCIIPGVILAARLLPVMTCLIDDDDLPFLDAFKMSWNMTKGHTMQLIGLGIALFIINVIGFCCCCVGLLFTIPLTYFAQALVYAVLKDEMTNNTVTA